MKKEKTIIKKDSGKPGKTIAIFSGIHGNEKAGVWAMDELVEEINPERGSVYFVYANPEAIEKDVRFVEKNLNRLFTKENKGETKEEKRAQELMKILDECDALLDLHAFHNEGGEPFVICEENSFEIAKKLDVPVISCGWTKFGEGATDEYMYAQGKVGICLECGPIPDSKKYVSFAKKAVLQFLQYFEVISSQVSYDDYEKRIIEAVEIIKKESDDFKFNREFKEFEKLVSGEEIATDGEKKYIAKENQVIIFPRPNNPIGVEVCIIGEEK
jgi:succinylglutamate desuccinylase